MPSRNAQQTRQSVLQAKRTLIKQIQTKTLQKKQRCYYITIQIHHMLALPAD